MKPERIGRYEIKAEIGRGGMATVYQAYDPRFKREVAIKVLPSQFLHDPTFRARFEREAMAIAAIEHPNIVPVYDYGEEEGQPYLVMRYMHGGSLSDRLKKGPLSLREATQIIVQLAPALDEMHSRGIIHRDLKPGNILFDHYGNAFISDFGIARLTEATTTLTGDAIIGTPSYMSPEQARGDTDIDGRSDIYAMGAIMFEMLTGKQPYQATTPMGIVMKHITEPIPRILEFRPDLPPSTEKVITQAMAKKREERFPTARDMAMAQEAVTKEHFSRQMAPTSVEQGLPALTVEKPPPEIVQKQPEAKAEAVKPSAELPRAEPSAPAPKPQAETRPPVEKPSVESKPASVAPAPYSRTPGVILSPPAAEAARSAKPATASVSPKPSSIAAQPVLPPAAPAAGAPEALRSRPWFWVGGAVVIITGLCLLASSLGIPRLIGAVIRRATVPSIEISSPTPLPPDHTPQAHATTTTGQTVDVFVDNFENVNSGWDRVHSDGSITDYESGYYRIYIDKPTTFYWSNPGLSFADVTLEVEASKISGPDDNFFGLICRYQDANNFYVLAISSDGYYSIRKYQDGVFHFLGADAWQYSRYIHQGKTTNILRADCIGDTLRLYVNGTQLMEAQDATFSSGDVGLTAAALDMAGTNILFDNFVATKP